MSIDRFDIAVSGMIASGKSTLARGIASNFGASYIPEHRISISYLDDLFNSPSRWAFETQISFLAEKANELRMAIMQNLCTVIDRSFQEDIEIFAGYFHKKGHLDNRSYQTYISAAKAIVGCFPEPKITIYCYADRQTIINRIKNRQNLCNKYPDEYIEWVFDRYGKHFSPAAMGYSINGNEYDWRDSSLMSVISDEITNVLKSEFGKTKLIMPISMTRRNADD